MAGENTNVIGSQISDTAVNVNATGLEIYTQFQMPVGIKTQPGKVDSLHPFGATAVRTIQVKQDIPMHLLDTFSLDDPAINVVQDRKPISKDPMVASRP